MQALVSSESHQIENTSEVIQCQSGSDIQYSYYVTSHQQINDRLVSHIVMVKVRDQIPELN